MKYFLSLLLIAIILCTGCDELKSKVNTTPAALPPGVKNVTYLDDEKWGTFELEKQKYLFRYYESGGWVFLPIQEPVEGEVDEQHVNQKLTCPKCGAKIVITELGPVHLKD